MTTLVLSTFPTQSTAEEAARSLVEKKLAACVNLIPQVRSIYRWKEKLVDESEVLAIIKTSSRVTSKLMAQLKEIHPNEVPEIVAVNSNNVSEAYNAWVEASVQG